MLTLVNITAAVALHMLIAAAVAGTVALAAGVVWIAYRLRG
jgi:hypothetical protein